MLIGVAIGATAVAGRREDSQDDTTLVSNNFLLFVSLKLFATVHIYKKEFQMTRKTFPICQLSFVYIALSVMNQTQAVWCFWLSLIYFLSHRKIVLNRNKQQHTSETERKNTLLTCVMKSNFHVLCADIPLLQDIIFWHLMLDAAKGQTGNDALLAVVVIATW